MVGSVHSQDARPDYTRSQVADQEGGPEIWNSYPEQFQRSVRYERSRERQPLGDAIKKAITNVGIGFHVLPESQQAPPGWRKTSGHLVLDVKRAFARKAR